MPLLAHLPHLAGAGGHGQLGEALLEIGLVIASITLLTRQRGYWFLGMAFGMVGIVAALLGFGIH